MNSCEVHPLSQTNDLRQFPKRVIIYKHLLAVMMIQSGTIVNAFMSSAKLLTSAEYKPVFFLSIIVLKPLQQLLCIYNEQSQYIGPRGLERQSFRLMGYKDRGEQWTSTWMKLLGNWNESKFSVNQICERSLLVVWAIWTGETVQSCSGKSSF